MFADYFARHGNDSICLEYDGISTSRANDHIMALQPLQLSEVWAKLELYDFNVHDSCILGLRIITASALWLN